MSDADPDLGLHHIKPSAIEPHTISAATTIPWPTEYRPKPVARGPAPSDSAPLTPHDVLIVTWTAGEAHTLASLFGSDLDNWHEYRHNVASFIPKVTGARAPFNDDSAEMKRYYHSLGIYASFSFGPFSVLALKSGLHMAYDGPDVPMVDLWKQLIAEVKPKVVITTGTGGGIGSDIRLGDVIVGAHTRFHLTGELKDKPYASASYPCTAFGPALEKRMKGLITTAMLTPNGDKLDPPRIPQLIFSKTGIVSTDTFAFDDSTDYFKLQGLGQCCDMGDATLGLAISQIGAGAPPFLAIRNASDPQIKNTSGIAGAKKVAEQIYSRSQCLTTAGSVIASWAAAIAVCG
jgi:nucleoside phosphorylase